MVEHQHVVVTGASRGLGRAIASVFSKHGHRISVIARSVSDLQSLQVELGNSCLPLPTDLCRNDQLLAALERARQSNGPVDILINNAGIGAYKPQLEMSFDEIENMIRLNFTSLVHLTTEVIKEMIPRKSGTIINIASDLGRKPLANMAVYAATKHAVVGFSQSLARELKAHNIKSIVVTPGIIDSSFMGRQGGSIPEPYGLKPEHLADVVYWLASQPAAVLVEEISVHPMGQEF